jgi:hypothetical protein
LIHPDFSMRIFSVAQEVTLNTSAFVRHYLAATNPKSAQVDRLYLDIGQELRLVIEKLQDEYAQAHPEIDEAAKKDPNPSELGLQIASEMTLLQWPFFPTRLGRSSSRLVGKGLHFHHEDDALPAQLQALRASKPDKQHFRIAFINGFGSNLGDCTIGVTAFRQVQRCLARYLPSFSCDMLFGSGVSTATADIAAGEASIERLLFQAPTVSEFAQYDGYFDFSGLIKLPKYDTLPMVDWYLWWCGLDPNTVLPTQKRNRIPIRWEAWNVVRNMLKDTPGQKILFNPKASTPLRTMPAQVASQFAKHLLELAPDIKLVIDQPMALQHDRVIDLSSQINTPERFKALVGLVDAIITVDSFAIHAADSCATPCVCIFSSVPASTYPYYPYNQGINLANIEKLPAYKKTKVSESEWRQQSAAYLAAWEALSPAQVWKALQEKLTQRRAAANEPQGLTLVGAKKASTCVETTSTTPRLVRQRLTPEHTHASTRFVHLSQNLIKPGSVCVQVCAPDANLSVALAHRVAPHGELIVLEPRTLLARSVESSLFSAGAFATQVQQTMAVAGAHQARISALDPWSESYSSEWGNTHQVVAVPHRSVDDMALKTCHLLLAQSPMPYAKMIAGALETLKRCRPYVLISPASRKETGAIHKAALNAGYVFWAEPATPGGDLNTMLLLGVPQERQVKIDGFFKVEVA